MSDPKSIVLAFQSEVGKLLHGKEANLSNYLHEDVCWHLPASLDQLIHGSERKGKVAVIDLIQHAPALCYQRHTMKFEFHSMIESKDFVHQHFSLSASTINGKLYSSGYQALFKVENSLITHVWEYFDSGLLLQLIND